MRCSLQKRGYRTAFFSMDRRGSRPYSQRPRDGSVATELSRVARKRTRCRKTKRRKTLNILRHGQFVDVDQTRESWNCDDLSDRFPRATSARLDYRPAPAGRSLVLQ